MEKPRKKPIKKSTKEAPISLDPESLEILPDDAIREIALKLDYEDLVRLCSSSKRLNRILCGNDRFWISKLSRDFPTPDNVYIENSENRLAEARAIYELKYAQLPIDFKAVSRNSEVKALEKQIKQLEEQLEKLRLQYKDLQNTVFERETHYAYKEKLKRKAEKTLAKFSRQEYIPVYMAAEDLEKLDKLLYAKKKSMIQSWLELQKFLSELGYDIPIEEGLLLGFHNKDKDESEFDVEEEIYNADYPELIAHVTFGGRGLQNHFDYLGDTPWINKLPDFYSREFGVTRGRLAALEKKYNIPFPIARLHAKK